MRISTTAAEWRTRRLSYADKSIGFVPTMGALHDGHAFLIERCRRENEVVQVSLFVNPTQFNDSADFKRYPNTLDADLALLEKLGADEILHPPVDDLYPSGYAYRITSDPLAGIMEGVHRPGFFDGVLTVVMKLLQLAGARRAYFGEKDYQQLQAVTGMAAAFFLPVEIVACPTVRAANGLALSSRNALLSDHAREKASLIYHSLVHSPSAAVARATLEENGFQVDYVEEHWNRRFAAAFLEGVRLIDNVPTH